MNIVCVLLSMFQLIFITLYGNKLFFCALDFVYGVVFGSYLAISNSFTCVHCEPYCSNSSYIFLSVFRYTAPQRKPSTCTVSLYALQSHVIYSPKPNGTPLVGRAKDKFIF